MRYFVLLLLIALVSGCVTQQTATGYGIIIKAFEPDMSEIYVNETFNLRLLVQNTGSFDGEIKDVKLTGIEWAIGECQPSIKGTINAPIKGGVGEEKSCIWTLTAEKGVPPGLSITLRPSVRVIYSYSSDVVATVTLVSREELKMLIDQGKSLPSETKSKSRSPIDIDINVVSPIKTIGKKITFPVEITVRNVGGGVVCKDKECKEKNKITLNIEGGDMRLKDCGKEQSITLWKGQSNTIVCKFEAGEVNGRVQKLIKVHADYGYFIDKETSITIKGI